MGYLGQVGVELEEARDDGDVPLQIEVELGRGRRRLEERRLLWRAEEWGGGGERRPEGQSQRPEQ